MYYPIIPHYPREAWLLSNDMFETQCNQSDIQGWVRLMLLNVMVVQVLLYRVEGTASPPPLVHGMKYRKLKTVLMWIIGS